jgi:CelD/BcsL family acetyltransferase involved in cellulose biosynthesis
LRIDGRIIAVLYGMHAHRRTYFYLSGFDSEFARLSPGTLIVAAAIEHARREGAGAFDFMRGREPYKYRWGAIDRPNAMRRLWL